MATTTRTDLTDSEALRLAVFALACLCEPAQEYDPDLEPMYIALDERGLEAIERLGKIYEQKRRIEQLTQALMTDEPVPCICGQCVAVDAALEAPTC